MKESSLTKKVRQYLKGLSPEVKYIRKDQGPHSGFTGVSDFLLCVDGAFVAIELKTEGNTPTRKQEIFLEEVRKAGGIAEVCYSLDEVKEFVTRILVRGNNER